mmetsp:Transcript_122519/g.342894  ORF Transcript_122519/g.342894 Transcript_122519/m.342894 type:complete len:100 (+) Transcript_122519:133-432(+)
MFKAGGAGPLDVDVRAIEAAAGSQVEMEADNREEVGEDEDEGLTCPHSRMCSPTLSWRTLPKGFTFSFIPLIAMTTRENRSKASIVAASFLTRLSGMVC